VSLSVTTRRSIGPAPLAANGIRVRSARIQRDRIAVAEGRARSGREADRSSTRRDKVPNAPIVFVTTTFVSVMLPVLVTVPLTVSNCPVGSTPPDTLSRRQCLDYSYPDKPWCHYPSHAAEALVGAAGSERIRVRSARIQRDRIAVAEGRARSGREADRSQHPPR